MIREWTKIPLENLQSEAFSLRRRHFGDELTFSIPGTVAYQSPGSTCYSTSFPALSVTGRRCSLLCGHCKGKLLESMIPAEDPKIFLETAERLVSEGALGMLVSGGADPDGTVPLRSFLPAIGTLKEKYPQFKVIVHTGLLHRETAKELKEVRVDQVLLDVIGDDETIREVYHLRKRVEDYEEALWLMKEVGLRLAPHIIIGHHFGEIKGEWRALEIVTRVGVETLVLVVMKTLDACQIPVIRAPTPEESSRIAAVARILNPTLPIRTGCIRPAHPSKPKTELGFIDSGVNTIAFPLQGTIDYAKKLGLRTRFVEMCCSLV